MAFVVRSERRLGPPPTACNENIGPGSYVGQVSSLSGKKRVAVKEPFQCVVDREGKNPLSRQAAAAAATKNNTADGMLPYYDELMDQKRNVKSKTHNPGPGQYDVPTGFDQISRTMTQVKALQNQGLENFGIQVIKNSCNFQSKQNRFDDRTMRDKAL